MDPVSIDRADMKDEPDFPPCYVKDPFGINYNTRA
jgi:hypothetical protein